MCVAWLHYVQCVIRYSKGLLVTSILTLILHNTKFQLYINLFTQSTVPTDIVYRTLDGVSQSV